MSKQPLFIFLLLFSFYPTLGQAVTYCLTQAQVNAATAAYTNQSNTCNAACKTLAACAVARTNNMGTSVYNSLKDCPANAQNLMGPC